MSINPFFAIEKACLIHDGELEGIGVSETEATAFFDFLDSPTTQDDAAAPATDVTAPEEQEEDFVRFFYCLYARTDHTLYSCTLSIRILKIFSMLYFSTLKNTCELIFY